VLSFQALYATYTRTWQVAPSALTLWIFTIVTFVIGCIGFKDKSSIWARLRSWFTVSTSILLSIIFLLGVCVNAIATEHIETVQSPDAKIIIDFYTLNGGAATSISVTGIVNGPLWFKKRIYYEGPMDRVDVEWIDNSIITINNHTLNLEKGEFYSN